MEEQNDPKLWQEQADGSLLRVELSREKSDPSAKDGTDPIKWLQPPKQLDKNNSIKEPSKKIFESTKEKKKSNNEGDPITIKYDSKFDGKVQEYDPTHEGIQPIELYKFNYSRKKNFRI